jgi:hypothetical protein
VSARAEAVRRRIEALAAVRPAPYDHERKVAAENRSPVPPPG